MTTAVSVSDTDVTLSEAVVSFDVSEELTEDSSVRTEVLVNVSLSEVMLLISLLVTAGVSVGAELSSSYAEVAAEDVLSEKLGEVSDSDAVVFAAGSSTSVFSSGMDRFLCPQAVSITAAAIEMRLLRRKHSRLLTFIAKNHSFA
ncbi:MAG: hypothetical protein ACI4Q6_09885 [Huintestinicola sp.]